MNTFPFFTDITDKRFLLVGGGSVAHGKLARLLQFTENITVIARESDITDVPVIRREFRDSDLDMADYCICATSDRKLNSRIAKLCSQRNIPVNVVDDPELCSFIFPSIIKRGDLVVGISSNGAGPTYAATLKKQTEEIIPDNIEEILEWMGKLRVHLPEEVKDIRKRKHIYKQLLEKLTDSNEKITEACWAQIVREEIEKIK